MNIVVIAAHPDDEVLGCGGTMAKHVLQGDNVHVLILAEGITSRDEYRDPVMSKEDLCALSVAAHAATKILGVTSLSLEKFPDNRLDSLDRLDVIKRVEQYINQYKPDMIYTHHAGDVNVDHRRIHEAVVTACRPIPGNRIRSLLFFEIPSSTEWQTPYSAPVFAPNWFVDITDTVEKKILALEQYQGEMPNWPHARSIAAVKHLIGWRGACCGLDACEAFVLGRTII
jgi:LmbE family N-acetylglucosaminyl deacetylase